MPGDNDDATHAQFSVNDALERLAAARATRSVALFQHGSLLVKFYAPRGTDPQMPHAQDEVYVVAQGTALFWNGADLDRCGPGDVLFAAARAPHRFEQMSDDFGVWVFFYGPDGGEVPAA